MPFRRRKEGRTDYRARRALVLSGKPRLVARGTLKNVVAQVVVAKPEGDRVLVSAHSNELARDFGWKASGGNVPSAYLTGFLCGLKAKAQGVNGAVPDIGLNSPSKGARVFAVLKGALDAGMDLPHSEEKLPVKDRLEGKHISDYAKSLSSTPELYRSRFSVYLKEKLVPEDLPGHVAEVKRAMVSSFKKEVGKEVKKEPKKEGKKPVKRVSRKGGRKGEQAA
jgi:large subunit ribosomal protein L18